MTECIDDPSEFAQNVSFGRIFHRYYPVLEHCILLVLYAVRAAEQPAYEILLTGPALDVYRVICIRTFFHEPQVVVVGALVAGRLVLWNVQLVDR